MNSKSNQKIITLILIILICISSYYFLKIFQNRETYHKIPDIKYGYIPLTPIKNNGTTNTQNNNETSAQKINKELININNADKASLISLPGIGEVLASRILKYRQTNGEFKNNTELKKVSGIGDKKLEAILPKLEADKNNIASKTSNIKFQGKNNSPSKKTFCTNCNEELIPDNNRHKTIKPYCRKCLEYLGK